MSSLQKMATISAAWPALGEPAVPQARVMGT